MLDYTAIRDKVKAVLPEKRFRHSQGVADTALSLAERFGIQEEKALIAGIYHDAYRYSGSLEYVEKLEEVGIMVYEEEKENPMLLHGPVAALFFDEFVGESVPQDMKDAVRHHTLGHKDMGALGAAVYIADYAEPGRTHLTEEEKKRLLSLPTLEAMVKEIILQQRPYFAREGIGEARVSTELYDYLEKGGRF